MKSTISVLVIIVVIALGVLFFRSAEDTDMPQLALAFSGLEPLASGHYEGWAIFGEEKVSTGTFSVGDTLEFNSDRDLSEADKIVVTIEPDGDADDVPSGVVILEGDVLDGVAELRFPVDLSSAGGNYILATPTDDPDANETSGIWFVTVPGPEAGLVLPELPDGFVYEGWAVNGGTPLSTGRFTGAEGADGFNGFSGEEAGPPFPGEDFLVNAPEGLTFPIDLADGASKAVISVEPDLNGVDPTGDGPFQVKPLVADIIEGAEDHTNYAMTLSLDSLPSGVATLQ